MSLISCKNLTLAYEGRPVVSDLSFEINQGDYLCIIGENGSGKTTLLRALLGLHNASAGELLLGDGLKRTEIGYLPQQSLIQRDFPASVYEVVLSGMVGKCGLCPYYSKEQKKRALEVLDDLEISSYAKRSYRQLSGGQQQRVLIARALCASSKLLILDEPVSGLDPDITAEMYDLIGKINRSGITIVMVSHDLDSALARASRILHVGKGFFGTPAAYMALYNGEKGQEK